MLTAETIEGFTTSFLLTRYADPAPIPQIHREMWKACCEENQKVAIACPRNHAKSTAITHALTLASVLFREARYVLVVSNTESISSNFLADIKWELTENEALRELFGIKKLTVNAVTDIVCEMEDGHKFRITAQGAEQRVRGKKWGGTRPDLIICDDLENDEMVESEDRREKFRSWFFRALVPCLSDKGKIRVVGTILHMDSLLYRLMNNRSWHSILYRAHASFDDFSNLLWPEKWPEERLRALRDEYIDDGQPEGYSQEMLNDPTDQSEAFFKREDFLPMEEEHRNSPKNYYAGIDFAISDNDRRAYTVIVVGGVDPEDMLNIVYVWRFRGDAQEIVDNMLTVQQRFNVEFWKAERGQISMTMEPVITKTSIERNVPILIDQGIPTKDKRSRARAIQARMRVGGVRFDKDASWYPAFEEELLHFPKGQFKDQVDAFAWLGIGINQLSKSHTVSEMEEIKWQEDLDFYFGAAGRNETTGY